MLPLMASEICGAHGGICNERGSVSNPFYVHLNHDFNSFMIVPCHVKNSFERNTGKIILVEAPCGNEYYFNIKSKRGQPTRLKGRDYENFIADYGMNVGDKVMFFMNGRPERIPIRPETANGQAKNHVLAENATVTICNSTTSGIPVELTRNQLEKYNGIMAAVGTRDFSFLHCLSSSDIQHDYLRIPKSISESLNLKKAGYAVLSVMGSAAIEADYARCADGRTRFTSGWHEFAGNNNFAAGTVLLMLFQIIDDLKVSIRFHAL